MVKDYTPRAPVNYSTRVDRVGVRPTFRVIAVTIIAIIMLIPVIWMGMTAFKSLPDAVSVPPVVIFNPTLEGFVNLFTQRRQLSAEDWEAMKQRTDLNWAEQIVLQRQQTIIGQSQFGGQLLNSIVIAGISTVLSIVFAVLSAYAFSRFEMAGKDDLLFFILSQRMLPAVVVTVPIFVMYRQLGLYDTHIGMILLYTSFNLSFAVWLLKGFIDEIPREYEDAALVDGYTRLQAFRKIVLPQSATGIAATTVFSFIFSWNEYAFALMLTSDRARTAPPSIPLILGTGGIEWSTIAAGSMVFLIPVVIVTFALRRHLLRGVTFGAIRKG
ncbi:MAG: carbohydrate ABC transporter permease [Anaerolineae bacterium]|nr:carbohydrate ABC transporter permease [Anaerolineae bacterium]